MDRVQRLDSTNLWLLWIKSTVFQNRYPLKQLRDRAIKFYLSLTQLLDNLQAQIKQSIKVLRNSQGLPLLAENKLQVPKLQMKAKIKIVVKVI